MTPPPLGHIVYVGLYREDIEKNLLFWNYKAKSLDIWYVASPSRPLQSLFKLSPWDQKRHCPGGHMFYVGLYRENDEKYFCLKQQGLEHWYLIWRIT